MWHGFASFELSLSRLTVLEIRILWLSPRGGYVVTTKRNVDVNAKPDVEHR